MQSLDSTFDGFYIVDENWLQFGGNYFFFFFCLFVFVRLLVSYFRKSTYVEYTEQSLKKN